MTRIDAGLAMVTADAMSRLHPGWDAPGARRLLLDCADLAPAHELAAAGVLFAGMTPGLKAPLREKFADRSQPWWRGLPEAARTVRPSEMPRCANGHPWAQLSTTGVCAACESERKATDAPVAVVMVDEAQAARNQAGAALVLAKLDEARRTG